MCNTKKEAYVDGQTEGVTLVKFNLDDFYAHSVSVYDLDSNVVMQYSLSNDVRRYLKNEFENLKKESDYKVVDEEVFNPANKAYKYKCTFEFDNVTKHITLLLAKNGSILYGIKGNDVETNNISHWIKSNLLSDESLHLLATGEGDYTYTFDYSILDITDSNSDVFKDE